MTSHDGWMWFGGGYMWLTWILVIVAVVFVIRFMAGNTNIGSTSTMDEMPLDILKKRYAKGEINEAEFKSKAKDLEK